MTSPKETRQIAPKKFFWSFLLLILFALMTVASFNWRVDSIRMFSTPDIEGFNYYKPNFFNLVYVSKPYVVRELKPDGIILGTSRPGSSLNTNHPGWQGYNAYNFSIAGTTALVHWWNFQHATTVGQVRRAVLGLDFYMFNSCRDQSIEPVFMEYRQRLSLTDDGLNWSYPKQSMKDYLSRLLSVRSTRESYKTVKMQGAFAGDKRGLLHLYPDGFWQSYADPEVSQRRNFRQIERQYLKSSWFPQPDNCYALQHRGEKTQLEYLRKLIANAHRENVELIMYFTPFHARLGEAMDAAGLWEEFEQLKREVLALNKSESLKSDRPEYPLWDFSGYNAVTTEPVPPLNKPWLRMKYFSDGSHNTELTGELIQNVIFDIHEGPPAEPGGFGVKLLESTIEKQLDSIRRSRQTYRSTHPQEVKEVSDLAAKILRK
jgi:hypothetical protein